MSAYQIGPETFVTVSSRVLDAEGECVSGPDVVAFVFGLGQLKPELEAGLDGRQAGDLIALRLPSETAFGRRDPERILELDPAEFPDGTREGDRFELEDAAGELLIAHVLEIRPDVIVIDTNHPLADQEVTFELEVLEVRPATSIELAAAEADLAEMGQDDPPADLVPASRLIRPRIEG